jgi:hypothetical protein
MQCRYRYDFLKGPSSSNTSRAASEAQVTNPTTGSSSKPKQRARKGKEREISSGLTATSAQVEDAPQESQTRRRGNKQTQTRKKASVITHTAQPAADPQPQAAQPSKGPRPRARRINKDGTQTGPNPMSQNDNPVQPAVPEPAASSSIGSPHASPSEAQDNTAGPSGAVPELARKRRHNASREELNPSNKKQKTLDLRRGKATKEKSSSQSADIVEKGNDTEMHMRKSVFLTGLTSTLHCERSGFGKRSKRRTGGDCYGDKYDESRSEAREEDPAKPQKASGNAN